MMIAIIGKIILAILSVLAFFFIEFEDEEDDYDDLMVTENIQNNTYSWANTQQQQTVSTPTLPVTTTDSNPNLEAYVQQLIVQGYDETSARAYAEQYRDRF